MAQCNRLTSVLNQITSLIDQVAMFIVAQRSIAASVCLSRSVPDSVSPVLVVSPRCTLITRLWRLSVAKWKSGLD